MPVFQLRAAVCAVLALALVSLANPAGAQTAPDGVTSLLKRLEQAAGAGDRAAILALADPAISRPSFDDFTTTVSTPTPTRVVVNERDRAPLDNSALRLVVEIFAERGIEGRLGTWRIDARPGLSSTDPWRILAVSRLSVVSGLYRLSLNTATEYDIHDLVVHAPDLVLEMPSGRAFAAETPDGPTALVLMGRGRMRFTPADPAERTQVHIFGGNDALLADLELVFLRFSPYEVDALFNSGSLRPRAVVAADLRTATSAFNDFIGRSLQLDLADISRDRWSLVPSSGDIVAELRTKKYGTLTYARSSNEAEDVTIFDRKRRRNISVYTSAAKLAERGRFYSEDARVDYDVLAYDLDVQINPDRSWIDGNARLKVKIQTEGLSSLTLRLAETVTVRGVYSPDFGRLLHLRVVGQNSVIVNLPAALNRDTELWLNVVYSGPIAPQTFDREAIHFDDQQTAQERVEIPLQQIFLYSNRSYWYPQATVTDYATASIRVTVPNDFDAIASGDPVGSAGPAPGETAPRRRKTFVFEAARPTRYLAVVVSRFNRFETIRLNASGSDVTLYLQGTPRAALRARNMSERAVAVFKFYASLVGDAPYPSFTLAVAESERPGGHSPPYFAVLNQVVVGSPVVWRNDPVSFENYPTFFLAHELAHQWWGHAVGWKNYHEQWISEGFAQYFAALYAENEREGSVLPSLLRQMRHTAIEASDQGPVYLGYRLGHIQGDDRIFRAIVYNKAAMVLHMLRRLVGDDAFFGGIRAFYADWKFKKAGTDDFQRAMEKASGRDLGRFFDTWIFGSDIPRMKFSYHVTGTDAAIRFEQHGNPVDVPITVTVTYDSGAVENVIVLLSEKETVRTLALKGKVRTISANTDNAALVEIDK